MDGFLRTAGDSKRVKLSAIVASNFMNNIIENRDKWIGVKKLAIHSISFAFQLISFVDRSNDTQLCDAAMSDAVHEFLWAKKEEMVTDEKWREWVKDNNAKGFMVSIEAINGGHGPNHCGLLATKIAVQTLPHLNVGSGIKSFATSRFARLVGLAR